MKTVAAAANLVLSAAIFAAQQSADSVRKAATREDSIRDVIERFQAIRPQPEELAVYGLDWAPTLGGAKARAAKEHRPVFLIIVTNSFGNIYTGHC